MARRPSAPAPRPADWPIRVTDAALRKQLAVLESFRGRNHREVEPEEREWRNLTLNVITHGFGNGSNNVRQFEQADLVGRLYSPSMGEEQYQRNFNRRVDALAATVKSSLADWF